jgi:hypothetical protein
MFEFALSIPAECRGADDEGSDRSLLVAAFGERLPSITSLRPKYAMPALPLNDPDSLLCGRKC